MTKVWFPATSVTSAPKIQHLPLESLDTHNQREGEHAKTQVKINKPKTKNKVNSYSGSMKLWKHILHDWYDYNYAIHVK